MLRALLQRRRAFRARVQREAADLAIFLGEHAYAEARQRSREARGRGDREARRLWSKVAVEIARQTGHEIGKQGGAKWDEARPRIDTRRREIADRLVEISRGIAALSAGRGDATTLHNIGVAARQVLDLAGATPALVLAADDVIAACEAIILAPTEAELSAGLYPSAVEEASRALQRLWAAALPG